MKQARAVSHGIREHLLRPEEPECAVPSRERVPEAPGGRLAGAALRPPPARPGHRRQSTATTPGPEPPPAQTYLVGGVGGGGRDVSTSRAAALRHHCGNKGCVSGPAPTRAGHGSPPRMSCEEAAPGTRSAARRDRSARHLPPGPRHPAAGRFPPPFTLPRQKPLASLGCRVGRTPTLSPARPQVELHREAGTRVRLRPAQRGPGRARGGAGLRAGSLCACGRAFVLGSPLPATGERWQTRCSPSRRTARVCGENAPRMLDAERLGRGHRGRVAHGPQGPGPRHAGDGAGQSHPQRAPPSGTRAAGRGRRYLSEPACGRGGGRAGGSASRTPCRRGLPGGPASGASLCGGGRVGRGEHR